MVEFLAMGGYAAYVWSAYALAGAVLVLNAVAARRAERRALDDLTRELFDHADDTAP